MKTLKQLITAAILSVFASTAIAQISTTPNLLTNQWSGISISGDLGGQHPISVLGPTTSFGSGPFLDNSTGNVNGQTGQIIWSYGQATVQQIIAVNQALSGTGLQVNGYNWGYELRNMNGDDRQGAVDTLIAYSFLKNTNGTVLLSATQAYNTKQEWNWHGGTVTATTPHALANVGQLGIQFTSADSGFWAGYYGPQVRNVSLSLNYSVDQCTVNPQSSPTCPGYRTYYNMTDDGWAQVNLPFGFPFYGQVYTTSFMYTNGVVGFLNPNWSGYCCDGTDLNGQRFQANSPWNYAIYALNTDLYPGQNSQFYTQLTDNGTGIRYTWENVLQIGTNNENTFSVNIKDSGYIGINYAKINLDSWTNPLIGIAGDINQGQYYQRHYGPASSMTATAGTNYTFTGTEITDVCIANPLSNPQCPGYAAAYLTQQCSISALYDPACPGYAAAYLTYQCNISQLYSPSCPGYQQAYFDQQCSLSGLYSEQCPNYADALYVQQCTADPLYDSGCTGYAAAYALKYVVNAPSPSTDTTQIAVVTTDPAASAAPMVADPIVNQSVTSTATSASPAQAATATVPLVAAPATTATVTATAEPEKKEEKAKTETSATDSKDQPKTTRQALAERRMAAARAKAVEEGKQLANRMGEAATMEAQVAVQNVVIQAMGFTPGFDAYGRATLPDAQGYRPFEIYAGQRNVDNPAGRRFLTGSDQLHTEMVDQQYGGTR